MRISVDQASITPQRQQWAKPSARLNTDCEMGTQQPLLEVTNYTPSQVAWRDLTSATRQPWFWLALGWTDILQKYRGSLLGPFWLTLTTAVFIAGLGPLYANLFGLNTRDYLPFMAIGIISWNFIVGTLQDCSRAFIDAGPLMKQMKIPRTTHIFHILWRNIIIFCHNIPVVIIVLLYANIPVGLHAFLIVPGLLILCCNLFSIGLILAIVCARFRDVVQITSSVLMLGFFLTPVLWNPAMQRVPEWVINFNPFAAYVELIRAPLLNTPISIPLLSLALLSAVFTLAISAIFFIRYRSSIVYWV